MQPTPVDQRCEFLSTAWLAEATAFLQQEVRARPALRNVRWSLSETFDDAPPSLGAPNNCVSWSFAIQDGDIQVLSNASDNAELCVTGDYQTILAMAQTVYAAGPDAVARARREMQHRAGESAIKIKGAMPDNPEIAALLSALHDHMTARTIENPNFEHRVQRLGLTRQIQELATNGYTVIENAVSHAFAVELREHVEREVRAHHPFTTNGLMMRHRLFEEVAQHPLACTIAQSAVGHGMVLGAMSGTYKEAGPGLIDIHADYPLVRDPYPEIGLIAVACWALDDWTLEAGPTFVIPGSHKFRRAPKRDEPRDGAVPILMPKGSIALWAHGVWHWQGARSLPGARVAIHVTYNRVFVRQLDDFSAVDEAFYARNPPAFSTLMGQDDPFGKSSYRGHDGKRFAYAGKMMQS